MIVRTLSRSLRAPGSPIAVVVAMLFLSACAARSGPAADAPSQPVMVPGPAEEAEPEPDADADRERALDIRLDFEVVEQFLDLVEHGDDSDEALDRWVRLPGNQELLRRGWDQQSTTLESLKEAGAAAIRGELLANSGIIGRLDIGPWDVLREMVESIEARRGELTAQVSRALRDYLPRIRPSIPFTVYFHLGGSWDGRSSDHVYVNLSFFHSRGLGSLPGLDALLVHELFHRVQATTHGSIDDYSSRQAALFSIMLRIQQEGIARHLEYRYLRDEVPASALDRTNFWKYDDGLRHAREHAEVFDAILQELEDNRRDEVRTLANGGFTFGGPLYAVGHDMARTIDEVMGPAGVSETVSAGPVRFFEAYQSAALEGGRESILPPRLDGMLAALKRGYADDWHRAFLLRREGLLNLLRSEVDEAIEALEKAVQLDDTDAISAYNLACAYALAGNDAVSLEWLEEALERGFDDYKHVSTDPDLESLHDEPAFVELLRSRGFNFDPAGGE